MVPKSRNVSEGKMVEFACATLDTVVEITWNMEPYVNVITTLVTRELPGGRKLSVLGFTATAQHNNTHIHCIALNVSSLCLNHSTALLLVQGKPTIEKSFCNDNYILYIIVGLLSTVENLKSTEVEPCSLHFTWTAPYTLQGVPINYYNITISDMCSDGAVLKSYTTNLTEFLHSVSRLGETLEVVVAAVNDVGTGNSSVITAQACQYLHTIFITSCYSDPNCA